MNTDRPTHRMRLSVDAASLVVRALVVGAAVGATAVLYANPYGVPRVAAGVVFGSLVAAVAAGKHLKRSAASRALRPRQASDDYDWYPDRVTTERTGTGLSGFGR